jgi:hypothetical protein
VGREHDPLRPRSQTRQSEGSVSTMHVHYVIRSGGTPEVIPEPWRNPELRFAERCGEPPSHESVEL